MDSGSAFCGGGLEDTESGTKDEEVWGWDASEVDGFVESGTKLEFVVGSEEVGLDSSALDVDTVGDDELFVVVVDGSDTAGSALLGVGGSFFSV